MGSLFVEIGQCGCQIGSQLNPKLSTSYYCTRNRPPYRLHAMMIDTEPKVLQPILDKQPKWLDPINVKYFQYGRGNNWSYGYLHELPIKKYHQQFLAKRQFSHLQPDSTTMEKYVSENRSIGQYVLDKLRHQLETVDCAMAINVISSLGGGTGSGLGTKIIEKIRQEFNIDIFSHVVLPNKSGENPLQVYNCLLSLASIQENSTGIFTYQNDKLLSLFLAMEEKQSKQTTLDQINGHISSTMARFFRVNDLPNFDRFYSSIATDCILSPELKYLNLFSAESKLNKWQDVFNRLFDEVRNYQSDSYGNQFVKKDRKERLLHGQLLLVGKDQCQFEQRYSKKFRNIISPLFEDSLNIETVKAKGTHKNSLLTEQKKKQQKEDSRCEAIYVSNHSLILHYLGYLLSSGTTKYQAKAYLWHYQYADIEEALYSMQNVVEQYQYFTHSQ